ncbi:MAG: NAD(P)H-dependent oxidoreductase [Treponema sp.]|jgi:chromate reductase|nr:NAD(P)H-dependent oxidoreductase [Treponema sp.]
MDNKIIIGVAAGSARKESFSRKVAAFVSSRMPGNFETQTLDIEKLPLYNQDYDDEGKAPPEWTAFREKVQSLDGFLFVTPEYNRSFPPLLKNALDIASRPYGKNAWTGKPGALIGVSPGKIGAFGAVQHLRQVLSFLNILLLQQPEAYLGEAVRFLDDRGAVTNQETAQFLENFAAAFASWVERIRR